MLNVYFPKWNEDEEDGWWLDKFSVEELRAQADDWYDPDYYRVSSKNDPKGPTMGSNRVIRGGSWNSNAKFCRVSNRNGKEDHFRGEEIGLRLAL